MADTLKIYKGGSVVAQAEKAENGTATVIIENLDPSTEYAVGTFKAALSNAAGESAKVDVPAFTTKDVSVTGVTVAQPTKEVEVGATSQINATVAPSDAKDKTVSYKSSDATIAKVDNKGVVTGVKAGSADVTVTTNDGAKTAVTTVTVTAATPADPQQVSVDSKEKSADVSAE